MALGLQGAQPVMNLRRISLLLLLVAACGPQAAPIIGQPGTPDAGHIDPPGCQGAGCQNACPLGTMTSVTGVVTAPNGIDPVAGAVIYVGELPEFPAQVQCELCNQTTGAAIVSTLSATDGSFTLGPLPTATTQIDKPFEIQIITQKGRFMQVSTVLIENPCGMNFPAGSHFRLPSRTEGQDTIPKIAVATGDYDVMECVLVDLGIDADAFDRYDGLGWGASPGEKGDLLALLTNTELLMSYNIVFLNCAGGIYEWDLMENPVIRANLDAYVASGGRLYVTDWSYDYIEQVPAFSPVIDFEPGPSGSAPEEWDAAAVGDDGITTWASVLDGGLLAWLQAVEAATGDEVVSSDGRVFVEHFLSGWVMQHDVPVENGGKVWLEGDVSGWAATGVKPLTTTFDYNSCGRVLYSSYHTEGRDDFSWDTSFPGYCGGDLSPQERVLEYLILHIADCIIIE